MATQTPSSSTSEVSKKRKRRPTSSTSELGKKRKGDDSSPPRWKYEVFLSFYGKDTRKSFTDHLYVDLKRKGILVFRDDETLQRGEYISKALLKAIRESQYAIVIFSANYAFSKWCLMELAEIVEWEEKKRLTVLPIFYHVDPCDVRNQSGSFAEAFTAHEKDPKIDKKDTDMWKNALRKAGSIAGWHIHDRYESTIIQEISGRLSRELNSKFSRHDYDKLVAIDSHVDKMMELLDMESDDVRFVGIHGMGGVGKTTLAEIIYDRVSSDCRFEGSSFISRVREKSATARDLASLQKELLSMIMQEEIPIWDHHEGIRMIKKILQNKKVFIVLDDVDSDEQLTALAGDRKWFGPGSRVIITSRDSHLLRTHEVKHTYKVKQLETTKALQLFSLSAFKKTHPIEDYKDLSMDFVNYAQGLPLALKVLGSFLYEREIDAWKSEKDKLKAIPNPKIMDVLQISFDGLQKLQKELFLDLACLFQKSLVSYEMLESCGYYRIDIEVLIEKSLISKSKYGWCKDLSMHDLLKEMGQELVRCECPQVPGQRSRLFHVEDLYQVLKNDTGTDAIKGIVMDFCPKTKQRLNAEALSKMRKLRFFKFHHSQNIKWHGNPLKYMPTNELQFLEWSGYHLKSLPSSFQPKNLTVLRMSRSHIKQLWKGPMDLDNLKEFDLSYSENLIETPDLTGAPNLENINLKGCKNLCEVHPSIGSLKRLKQLALYECSSLEKLPDLSKLECLTNLWVKETAITQIPSVNLLPKSMSLFTFEGRELMRDSTYDIGSLVEYHMEGKHEVQVRCIDFDSKAEKILDIAGGIVAKLNGDAMMISGWSLGFNIPEWVRYKSNGSSVTIDLDGITNPEMGCALFIVCDSDEFYPLDEDTSISLLFKKCIDFSTVRLDLLFRRDEEEYWEECSFRYYYMPPLLDGCLTKGIGFWVYIPAVLQFLQFLNIRRRFIKISFQACLFDELGLDPLIEVKECGVHLVCPDDGAKSEFFNSIAPFRRSVSSDSDSNSDFHRLYSAVIGKKKETGFGNFHIRRASSVELFHLLFREMCRMFENLKL
ncbi:disease resistance protein RPV1-like isoform X2 [Carya illinoinensis]|uniref:TIR domain-containing protein n=1 Tax=Carya illinoinensis TaxID=32201 RepID=A0A8T1NMG3_CARIL|nr:disease resistance protein RPV1-like isoform X2 [Carya illinoinensis]KAG6630057.1 hypothetical protein CIPAW_14G128500 [Carya illinoinensis]